MFLSTLHVKIHFSRIINEICNISVDDSISIEMKKIELIREDDDYGGYRVTFEAIIKRGIIGTRIRDYYDVYMLLNTQSRNINFELLKSAVYHTAEHRNTVEIINDSLKVIEVLKSSDTMKKQWERYKKDNFYARDIEYEDLIVSLEKIEKLISN